MIGLHVVSSSGKALIKIGDGYEFLIGIPAAQKFLFAIRITKLIYIFPDSKTETLGKISINKDSEIILTDDVGNNIFVNGGWPIINRGNYIVLIGYEGERIESARFCNLYVMDDPNAE